MRGNFNGADVLVLGGDMDWQGDCPIVEQGAGLYKTTLLQQDFELRGATNWPICSNASAAGVTILTSLTPMKCGTQ